MGGFAMFRVRIDEAEETGCDSRHREHMAGGVRGGAATGRTGHGRTGAAAGKGSHGVMRMCVTERSERTAFGGAGATEIGYPLNFGPWTRCEAAQSCTPRCLRVQLCKSVKCLIFASMTPGSGRVVTMM